MALQNMSSANYRNSQRSYSNVPLDYEKLNQELKTNNERIYILADSILERKISDTIANPIINEFKARNEYLRKVIGDLYKNKFQSFQEKAGQTRNLVNNNTSSSLPVTTADSGLGSESSSASKKSNPSKSKDTESASRYIRWVSKKTTLTSLREKGYDTLVDILNHYRINGQTFMWAYLQQGKAPGSRKPFVLKVSEIFDANKYLLKQYVDSIRNGSQISRGKGFAINYIRQTRLEKLERNDLICAEKMELADHRSTRRARMRAKRRKDSSNSDNESTDIDS